jgi:hypothetical protein
VVSPARRSAGCPKVGAQRPSNGSSFGHRLGSQIGATPGWSIATTSGVREPSRISGTQDQLAQSCRVGATKGEHAGRGGETRGAVHVKGALPSPEPVLFFPRPTNLAVVLQLVVLLDR